MLGLMVMYLRRSLDNEVRVAESCFCGFSCSWFSAQDNNTKVSSLEEGVKSSHKS